MKTQNGPGWTFSSSIRGRFIKSAFAPRAGSVRFGGRVSGGQGGGQVGHGGGVEQHLAVLHVQRGGQRLGGGPQAVPAFGKAAEGNPLGFTIRVEDNATAHLQAGPAGPGGRTTLQYQKG